MNRVKQCVVVVRFDVIDYFLRVGSVADGLTVELKLSALNFISEAVVNL
jgi:hypothetical protein